MTPLTTQETCVALGRPYTTGNASPALKRDLAKLGIKPVFIVRHNRGPRYFYHPDDIAIAVMKLAKAAPKQAAPKPRAPMTVEGELFERVTKMEKHLDQIGTLLAALVRAFDGPSVSIATGQPSKSNGAGTHTAPA